MIEVRHIGKTYQVWTTPLSRLMVPVAHRFLRPLFPVWYQRIYAEYCTEVHALNDVSFSLDQGDSLGIIGLNGSGKSTLLQIVAGTLTPTSGSVSMSGRVAALLELGSGFDPEFTGKENVFLNAAILGLTADEIAARYEDIVAFAAIGNAIDLPVKTYSSGMLIRLAFAVQVYVEPDILIVDEALAVGDARFQAKALNKLEEILGNGTTLLFVGHDLNTVKSFCNRAMLLHGGEMVQQGLPEDVISEYLQLVQLEQQSAGPDVAVKSVNKGFSLDGYAVTGARIDGYGEHASLAYDANIQMIIDVQLGNPAKSPFLIMDVIDQKGLQLTGRRIPIPCKTQSNVLSLEMQCSFQKGIYRVRLRIVDAPSIEQSQLLSRQDDLLSFEMVDDVRGKFTGLFPVPMTCRWAEENLD